MPTVVYTHNALHARPCSCDHVSMRTLTTRPSYQTMLHVYRLMEGKLQRCGLHLLTPRMNTSVRWWCIPLVTGGVGRDNTPVLTDWEGGPRLSLVPTFWYCYSKRMADVEEMTERYLRLCHSFTYTELCVWHGSERQLY